ncbi:helix-turn-helix domain-containing protein, partial [Lactobacillus sp. S2-2]|uniref:helix-turn-helix domain-containing protein n=1 Tax=Lactobacillus sp. S2-2 TaxID=2692917 RepID=UPI001F3C2932|nr:helix-turn-helix domain-containing protein [Lactobacillus sp. S2-2]
MVKYNFELKIKIVLEYLEKGHSSNYLCKKYNIKRSGTILYWVKLYQTYGLSGIKSMTNHIIYPGEFKQKVLHWMHTNHSSYPETALQFKISSPSVIF